MSRTLSRPSRTIGSCLVFLPVLAGLVACGEPSAREIVGSARPFEGRLGGGFAHAPCPATVTPYGTRLDCPALPTETRLVLSETYADRVAGPATSTLRGGGPAPDREWAIREGLTATDAESLADPIAALRELVAREPENAGHRSDLAALLLRRQALGGSPRDLVEASSEAREAKALDPTLSDARFNFAVALERLYVRSTAADAWRDFLEVEPSGPWADEARERLANLEAPLPEPEPVRLDTSPVDDPEAAAVELLELLESASSVDAQDRVAAEIRRFAEDLEGALDGESHASLVAGYRAMAESAASENCAVKRPALARAASAFEAAPGGEALVALADYRDLRCIYWARDAEATKTRGLELLRAAEAAERTFLATRIAWILGTNAFSLNRFGAAEAHYLRALEHAEPGDGCAESVYSLLAELRDRMGDPEDAWRHRIEALRVATSLPGHPRLSLLFIEAGRSMREKGAFDLALAFQDEAVPLDEATGRPLDAAEAHLTRLDLLLSAGRFDDATRALNAARRHANAISDEKSRRHTKVVLDLLAARASLSDDPATTLQQLERVDASFFHEGLEYWRLEMESLRGRALATLGRNDEAARAWRGALAEFDKRRESVSDPLDRIRLLDQARGIVDQWVALEWESDPAIAWQIHERTRARELRERLGVGVPSSAAVREALPTSTLLVDLRVQPDRVLGWRIDRESVVPFEVAVSRREIEESVERFRRAIVEDDSDAFYRLGATLHGWLLEPADLPDEVDLVIAADSALRGLPFAALFDPDSRTFAIERHALALVPGAALLLREPTAPRRASPTILAVGDPAFDRKRHRLDRLPAAESEAREIAALFSGSRALVGSEATPSAFFESVAEGFSWIHVASHAVSRADQPLESALLLAPEPDHPGDLLARDLYDVSFRGVDLVFLAACGTGTGYGSALEGTLDLSHPLLANGVPNVVTTLWPIQDRRSLDFSRAFYDALSTGVSPSRALRSVQVSMIGSTDRDLWNPSTWAAYQIVGAAD